MKIKVGIIGLPNVGKSTLFNAITSLEIETANYPFATIDPNYGIVEVKDKRLTRLAEIFNSKKIIYSQVEFVDIAGLVKGASKGEGLGNKFLSNIREVDAIIHLVRLFKDEKIIHVHKDWNPINDIKTIDLELFLADLEQIERWLNKNETKFLTLKTEKALAEVKLAKRLKTQFANQQKVLRIEEKFSTEELLFIKQFNFLSFKPTLLVGNITETEIVNYQTNNYYQELFKYAKKLNLPFLVISAKVEAEIAKIVLASEKEYFLKAMQLKESGINLITKTIFNVLNLNSFFTVGETEAHAWSFKVGTNAKHAAGIIHSDFAKGFIKAEVYNYKDIIKYPSEQLLKTKGLIRIEGKEYLVKDGDICHFRFNL